MTPHISLPHLVRPEFKWKIEPVKLDKDAQTVFPSAYDPHLAILTAPEDNGHMAELTRNHEMAHARFTHVGLIEEVLKFKPHFFPRAIQWAEDMRIALLARPRGVETLWHGPECHECDASKTEFVQRLKSQLVGLTKDPGKSAEALVKILATTTNPDPLPTLNSLKAATMWVEKKTEEIHNLLALTYPPSIGDWRGKPMWQEMKISLPPLEVVCSTPREYGRHKGIAQLEGSIPRHYHRALLDGYVFVQHKPRGPGKGSVLIDVSGSMKLEPNEIFALCHVLSSGIIASYYSDPFDRYGGRLTVLARNGKMVKAIPKPEGDGNGCDGPALHWLAEQEPPRVWVSDGYVTGYLDRVDLVLVKEAAAIQAAASITRVCKLDQVQRAL